MRVKQPLGGGGGAAGAGDTWAWPATCAGRAEQIDNTINSLINKILPVKGDVQTLSTVTGWAFFAPRNENNYMSWIIKTNTMKN